MTNLIYLPGFNSGPQSEKSILLKQVFPELVVPVYDTWHPQRAFKQLDRLLEPILQQRPVLIGSSLGGFWAYQFAARHALRCVLLNPCMTPEISLKCAVGRVQHFYTQEVGELSLADLEQYAHYRSIPHADFRPLQHCTVLHEKGDEIIPYQESIANFADKARLLLLEGGHHRFAHMETAIAEIRAMCQQS